MNNILYRGGTTFQYASSLAATWVWAPALYVSSSIGYYYGLTGLLIFLLPNILGLLIFGVVSNYSVNHSSGTTFRDAISKALPHQKTLHTVISIVILICSSLVQIIGMHLLMTVWFDIDKYLSTTIISIISLIIVWKTGIKGSIISDSWKYIVTAIVGIILLSLTLFTPEIDISKVKIYDEKDFGYLLSFGITTTIGLLSAPYIDQTFWQRAYSIDKKNCLKTFLYGSLLFGVVPLCFGLIGILYSTIEAIPGWQVSNQFTGISGVLLGSAVFCALLSTLDSNLCAIQSLYVSVFNEKYDSRISYVFLLTTSSLLFIFTDVTITELFLIYGTVRTCMAIPTILIIFNKFNKTRLFYSSVCAVILGAGGFLLASIFNFEYAFIFTILALLIPLIGYSKQNV